MAVVTGTVNMNASFTQTNSTGLVTPLNLSAVINQIHGSYANGTAAGQVDLMFASSYALASTTAAFDLTSLTDLAGGSINMARVREFIVQVVDTVAAHTLAVYASSASGWTPLPGSASAISAYANGGMFRLSDPYSTGSSLGYLTGSAAKKLVVDAGSNAVSFNLLILGCSAVS